MLIKKTPSWAIPESRATPEHLFLNRRDLIKGIAAGSILAAGAPLLAPGRAAAATDPTADLYPAPRNERYMLDRAVTSEDLVTTYNNFYEFGSHKKISKLAQKLEIRPWQVTIDGMVEKEITIEADDLIRRMPLEERLYRHRCVEAWSMAVPWSGFALRSLVDFARPLGGAKYLVMSGFMNLDVAKGQRQTWYPWPYMEGLTLAEARHELAFMVTGAYGKPVAKQNGAPLRLAVPWKYGFKHIKSITRFTFSDTRPKTFWEELAPAEYGFWANVNPEVAHPRWSQAMEKPLGQSDKVPTLLFNGYAETIADLYKGLEAERLYA